MTRAPARLLLALDLDGTLRPLASGPEGVRLTARQRSLLSRLERGGARVAVISGRALDDLRPRIGVKGIEYGGAFGLQMSGPAGDWTHPGALAARGRLTALAARLRRELRGVPGARVEDKGVALAVHDRAVPPAGRERYARALARARADATPGVRWRRGELAWEATPDVRWDKGRAALRLWRRHGRPYLLAFGDGPADEPMLVAANARGAGVRVGDGVSRAARRVAGPDQVWALLRALARRLESSPASTRGRSPRGPTPPLFPEAGALGSGRRL